MVIWPIYINECDCEDRKSARQREMDLRHATMRFEDLKAGTPEQELMKAFRAIYMATLKRWKLWSGHPLSHGPIYKPKGKGWGHEMELYWWGKYYHYRLGYKADKDCETRLWLRSKYHHNDEWPDEWDDPACREMVDSVAGALRAYQYKQQWYRDWIFTRYTP